MTDSEGMRREAAGLVLSGVGEQPGLAGRVGAAASRLAALAGLPPRSLESGLAPARALAALGEGRGTDRPPAWLAPLPLDPGLALPEGGTWAEALGAWRQPTILLLGGEQLATGWPAAGTALLRQARVPLVGLLQWGGVWEPELRRADGLPWLGWLGDGAAPEGADADDADDGEAGRDALAALARRWRSLDLL